jgi:hypothetical protein
MGAVADRAPGIVLRALLLWAGPGLGGRMEQSQDRPLQIKDFEIDIENGEGYRLIKC